MPKYAKLVRKEIEKEITGTCNSVCSICQKQNENEKKKKK